MPSSGLEEQGMVGRDPRLCVDITSRQPTLSFVKFCKGLWFQADNVQNQSAAAPQKSCRPREVKTAIVAAVPQSDPSLDNESRKLYGPLHAKVIAVSKAASETLLSAQGKSINIIQHITFSTFVVTTRKANKCAHPRKQTIIRLGSACFQAGRNMMFTCSEIR